MDGVIGVVTETWLRDDAEDLKERALEGHGVGLLTRNRSEAAANGVTYGGVAVLWKAGACNLKSLDFPNPLDFEVLLAAGRIKGHTRKLVVMSCYLPPGYVKARGEAALEHISDAVVHVKRLSLIHI